MNSVDHEALFSDWDAPLDSSLDEIEPKEALSSDDVVLKSLLEIHPNAVPDDPISSEFIIPEQFDILCGRDKMAHSHFGNKRFRRIINENSERYKRAKNRQAKSLITAEIIAILRKGNPGGRFLKLDTDTMSWYDVGHEYTHEKVSHALRSAKGPEDRKPVKGGVKRARRPTVKKYTERENRVFKLLLDEQQKIFKSLLDDIPNQEEKMGTQGADDLSGSSIDSTVIL